MQISQRRLVGLPVKTRSGAMLGNVADLVLETDTGRLACIVVRSRGFIPGLMDHELRVAWAQVISMSETEVVVMDGTIPSAATRFIASLTGKRLTS
ncbi:MAG: PRC-barrel domain-containing protein [Patescibacteria group bacterium]